MKFNFGTGIAAFYILFAGALVFVVIKAKSVHTSLVVENYYEEDLAYQTHFDKVVNQQELAHKIEIVPDWEQRQLVVFFPEGHEDAKGSITLYRPSDNHQDLLSKINPDAEGLSQRIDISGLTDGLWRIKIDWKSGSKSYFQEEHIVLQP